jgi:hypothetical protein
VPVITILNHAPLNLCLGSFELQNISEISNLN